MFRQLITLTVLSAFICSLLTPVPKVQAQNLLGLPEPGVMVSLSPVYNPPIIRGLTVHKDNPFLFDFIVDVGQNHLHGQALKSEGEKLIKYFLASLAIPEKDLWVNLSPYEKDRTIPQALGETEMGRDLLAQDYILKQITASLIYPEKNLGKTFWDKVYAAAQEQFGTTQIPVNTFNKVWIMADKAEVFEHNQTVFVVKCHLKVMLEEDYFSLMKHQPNTVILSAAKDLNRTNSLRDSSALPQNDVHSVASKIIRQIILPQLEREVNTGKNFAPLRQICNSLILANWYKKNLQEAILNQVYTDKETVKGIALQDKAIKKKIYDRYLQAYKKGVFNYIKEDVNETGKSIPRKYFSGGFVASAAMVSPQLDHDPGELAQNISDRALVSMETGMRFSEGIDAAMIHHDKLMDEHLEMERLLDDLDPQHPFLNNLFLKRFNDIVSMLADDFGGRYKFIQLFYDYLGNRDVLGDPVKLVRKMRSFSQMLSGVVQWETLHPKNEASERQDRIFVLPVLGQFCPIIPSAVRDEGAVIIALHNRKTSVVGTNGVTYGITYSPGLQPDQRIHYGPLDFEKIYTERMSQIDRATVVDSTINALSEHFGIAPREAEGVRWFLDEKKPFDVLDLIRAVNSLEPTGSEQELAALLLAGRVAVAHGLEAQALSYLKSYIEHPSDGISGKKGVAKPILDEADANYEFYLYIVEQQRRVKQSPWGWNTKIADIGFTPRLVSSLVVKKIGAGADERVILARTLGELLINYSWKDLIKRLRHPHATEVIKILRAQGIQLYGDPIPLEYSTRLDLELDAIADMLRTPWGKTEKIPKVLDWEKRILNNLRRENVRTLAQWISRTDLHEENGFLKWKEQVNWLIKTYLDPAMGTNSANALRRGGIDLNTSKTLWTDRKEGAGVEMKVDQAMLARLRQDGIGSLSPEIYSITPIVSIWPLIGF